MRKRHENRLYDLFDHVQYDGYAVAKCWKLLVWFGYERYTVGIRRDIQNYWTEWEDRDKNTDEELVFLRPKGSAGSDVIIMQKRYFVAEDSE
ncbi:MAG: hypothetical protein FWD67_01325 [Betaproteobacteria bacterium]|nr:hypothetical protein [Betaproteobacteria bacterium]